MTGGLFELSRGLATASCAKKMQWAPASQITHRCEIHCSLRLMLFAKLERPRDVTNGAQKRCSILWCNKDLGLFLPTLFDLSTTKDVLNVDLP